MHQLTILYFHIFLNWERYADNICLKDISQPCLICKAKWDSGRSSILMILCSWWLIGGRDAYHLIHTRSRCSASYTRDGKGGGGGGSVLYFLLFIYAYLLLHLYVCPRSPPILYRIAHTFIAYTHFSHILDCARHARHNPYVGHAKHQLYNDYARTGNL